MGSDRTPERRHPSLSRRIESAALADAWFEGWTGLTVLAWSVYCENRREQVGDALGGFLEAAKSLRRLGSTPEVTPGDIDDIARLSSLWDDWVSGGASAALAAELSGLVLRLAKKHAPQLPLPPEG